MASHWLALYENEDFTMPVSAFKEIEQLSVTLEYDELVAMIKIPLYRMHCLPGIQLQLQHIVGDQNEERLKELVSILGTYTVFPMLVQMDGAEQLSIKCIQLDFMGVYQCMMDIGLHGNERYAIYDMLLSAFTKETFKYRLDMMDLVVCAIQYYKTTEFILEKDIIQVLKGYPTIDSSYCELVWRGRHLDLKLDKEQQVLYQMFDKIVEEADPIHVDPSVDSLRRLFPTKFMFAIPLCVDQLHTEKYMRFLVSILESCSNSLELQDDDLIVWLNEVISACVSCLEQDTEFVDIIRTLYEFIQFLMSGIVNSNVQRQFALFSKLLGEDVLHQSSESASSCGKPAENAEEMLKDTDPHVVAYGLYLCRQSGISTNLLNSVLDLLCNKDAFVVLNAVKTLVYYADIHPIVPLVNEHSMNRLALELDQTQYLLNIMELLNKIVFRKGETLFDTPLFNIPIHILQLHTPLQSKFVKIGLTRSELSQMEESTSLKEEKEITMGVLRGSCWHVFVSGMKYAPKSMLQYFNTILTESTNALLYSANVFELRAVSGLLVHMVSTTQLHDDSLQTYSSLFRKVYNAIQACTIDDVVARDNLNNALFGLDRLM